MTAAARIRNARVLAVKLDVECPFCNRLQPIRPGIYVWNPDDVRLASGLDYNCVHCGEKFRLTYANRVSVIK